MATDDLPTTLGTSKAGRRSYLPHEIETALQALVMCGGSTTRACRLTGIPRGTLDDWKVWHRERIEIIRRERGPELEQMAINGFRAFVVRAEEAKALALEETVKRLADGTARDPGRDLSSISVAQGISVQRMLELDGRPQGVPGGEASVGELMRKLHGMFGGAVEGSATEEPAPQIEPPAPA